MANNNPTPDPNLQPIHRMRGSLPLPLSRFADTPLYRDLSPRLTYNQRRGKIMAVSGPVGVGKTEATAQALRDLNQRAAWIQMSTGLSARGHMAEIWRGVTGTRAADELLDIRDDLIEYLRTNDTQVLAMDDAHFIPPSGLRVLVSVWNELHLLRGRGIPMVLIGNGLLRKLAVVPEALSRVGPRVEAAPLHGESLLSALTQIEPRLADSEPDMLLDIDRRFLKGELRQWAEFIEAVRSVSDNDSPITRTEAGTALSLLGFITTKTA